MTKFSMFKSAAIAIVAISFVSTTSFAASQSAPIDTNKLAFSINEKLKSGEYKQQHNFLLHKLILDAGARANGTKRESAGGEDKHASWCARWNKTYDPSSNTIAGFGDARLPCISPYGN